jgi:hypothetical protein
MCDIGVLGGQLKELVILENIDVDGRVILKCLLKV